MYEIRNRNFIHFKIVRGAWHLRRVIEKKITKMLKRKVQGELAPHILTLFVKAQRFQIDLAKYFQAANNEIKRMYATHR